MDHISHIKNSKSFALKAFLNIDSENERIKQLFGLSLDLDFSSNFSHTSISDLRIYCYQIHEFIINYIRFPEILYFEITSDLELIKSMIEKMNKYKYWERTEIHNGEIHLPGKNERDYIYQNLRI